MEDLSAVSWRTATKSGGGGACVEVAITDGAVFVRNSKQPNDAVCVFTHQEWDAFLDGAQKGEFALPS